ncbi:phosphotransferase enzyme family protein [Sediminibacillus halophilus]|uniref:Ser/Thr protein kinase RdoA involved in Cpx stress response, MazF antagonist n=1 Tax=Sediminibacillus halophilus TaxID=482461 RepID=A0A1G9VUX1_9BACI|nr:phosphotransferase [Sediminibacillus halophilus]SDM76048.1 Ser/Thr protein kinase RdoA involved in Cpx stress response, MazF antagonist [Sediminibacillus halophilus]
MEEIVGRQFTGKIMEYFLEVFGLEKTSKKLGDFENYVYEVTRGSEDYILRITHSSHRSLSEVEAELDWIEYLADHSIHVCRPYFSKTGRVVETMTAADGTEFYGCWFSKAPGSPVQFSNLDEKVIHSWGKTIGAMHRVSKFYHPKEQIGYRKAWHQDDLLEVERYLPASESLVISHAQELLETLYRFPKTSDNYGLIHNDIHSGNFHYNGDDVHIFDFDDSCYLWYVSDIAIPVYYSVQFNHFEIPYQERNVFTKAFLAVFLEGYQKENELPDQWQEQLKWMLMLRDITLYSVLHKKISPQERNQRIQQIMSEIKNRIEAKQPIVSCFT